MTPLAALLNGTAIKAASTAPPHLSLDRVYACTGCRKADPGGYAAHFPPRTVAAARTPDALLATTADTIDAAAFYAHRGFRFL